MYVMLCMFVFRFLRWCGIMFQIKIKFKKNLENNASSAHVALSFSLLTYLTLIPRSPLGE